MDLIQEQFVKAITDNPRDWTARKIYADWLDDHDQPEDADKQRNWNDEKQDAWEWLEKFASEGGTTNFNERAITINDLIDAGNLFLDSGEYHDTWCQEGDENLSSMMTSLKTRIEFWTNFEKVTGRNVEDKIKQQGRPFSCSC